MSTIFQALDSKTKLIPDDPSIFGRAGEPLKVGCIRSAPIQLAADSPLLPFDRPRTRAGEQYRAVRTSLLQHPYAPAVLAVASCGPGDGKTLSAINTAGALAIKGDTTVLLVDADLRNSNLAPALGLPGRPGLAGVLQGECKLEEAVVRTAQLPNLYVLPAGDARRNPAELLDSAAWRELCAIAKNSFRFVLIDTPPVAAVTDYELVQAVCDGIVFVVRPDHSNRSLCLSALAKVNESGRLIGILVNCAEDWSLYRRYGRYPYPYPNPPV